MKAFAVREPGATAQSMEVPVPGIGDDEVLVRVAAIGVGLHDRWFMPRDARFPYVIGIEAAGTIEAAGRAVPGHNPGDRVMFTSSTQPNGGVWAEFAAVPARSLVRIPDELAFTTAAALPVAGGTAVESVRALGLQPGDSVFMAGASGAIGTMAIQATASLGARIAASASAVNHEYMRSLGAEVTVDYRDPDWVKQVRNWRPKGVDAALAIQPGTGISSLKAVRGGGRLVTVSVDPVPPERGIQVTQMRHGDTQRVLTQLASEVAAGRIHVEIERIYPFEQGLEALAKTETRRARGKVVLNLKPLD